MVKPTKDWNSKKVTAILKDAEGSVVSEPKPKDKTVVEYEWGYKVGQSIRTIPGNTSTNTITIIGQPGNPTVNVYCKAVYKENTVRKLPVKACKPISGTTQYTLTRAVAAPAAAAAPPPPPVAAPPPPPVAAPPPAESLAEQRKDPCKGKSPYNTFTSTIDALIKQIAGGETKIRELVKLDIQTFDERFDQKVQKRLEENRFAKKKGENAEQELQRHRNAVANELMKNEPIGTFVIMHSTNAGWWTKARSIISDDRFASDPSKKYLEITPADTECGEPPRTATSQADIDAHFNNLVNAMWLSFLELAKPQDPQDLIPRTSGDKLHPKKFLGARGYYRKFLFDLFNAYVQQYLMEDPTTKQPLTTIDAKAKQTFIHFKKHLLDKYVNLVRRGGKKEPQALGVLLDIDEQKLTQYALGNGKLSVYKQLPMKLPDLPSDLNVNFSQQGGTRTRKNRGSKSASNSVTKKKRREV